MQKLEFFSTLEDNTANDASKVKILYLRAPVVERHQVAMIFETIFWWSPHWEHQSKLFNDPTIFYVYCTFYGKYHLHKGPYKRLKVEGPAWQCSLEEGRESEWGHSLREPRWELSRFNVSVTISTMVLEQFNDYLCLEMMSCFWRTRTIMER